MAQAVSTPDVTDVCRNLSALCLRLADDAALSGLLASAIERCVRSLSSGGTIFFCGNGGSAADSQHLAGELVSRFLYDRPPLRSVALNADTAILTAVGNDYGYESSLSRSLAALGRPGDVLVALSTSGRSVNVLAALRSAADSGIHTIGLTGRDGGECPLSARSNCGCLPTPLRGFRKCSFFWDICFVRALRHACSLDPR